MGFTLHDSQHLIVLFEFADAGFPDGCWEFVSALTVSLRTVMLSSKFCVFSLDVSHNVSEPFSIRLTVYFNLAVDFVGCELHG